MKNVLMLAHDDVGQEARFQAALDLTRTLSGHLNCLDVTPPALMSDPMIGIGAAAVLYDETEQEAKNLATIERRLAGEDVSWSCAQARGEFSTCLLEAARSADIVVLNRADDAFPSPHMSTVVGEVLFKSEALVVAVSDDERGFPATGPALIAWNGSERAMRAVRRAVPLLLLTENVFIYQAGALAAGALPAEEVAAYLSRHGIKPQIEIGQANGSPAGEISRAASRLGAAYCVMGGFGQSRLREALFGGVTHELLSTSGLPLVIGH